MEYKTCSKCHLKKSLDCFNKKSDRILQTYCKDCQKNISHEHYVKNKHTYLSRNIKRKIDTREFINSLKLKPCVDCGNQYDPCAMDFDHMDDKEYDISSMVTVGFSKKSILKEILKCELVCAVCHRIRTKKRLEKSISL